MADILIICILASVNDKNIMNLNKNDSILPDIVFRTEQFCYKRSYYRSEVQLQFKEASSLFLETIDIYSIHQLQHIMQGYTIQSVNHNTLVFRRKQQPSEHAEFIKRIQHFFSNYKIIIIQQTYQTQKKLSDLQKKIRSLNQAIGVSKEVSNNDTKKREFFIYCDLKFQQLIISEVDQFRLRKKQKIVFSLNHFIPKRIHPIQNNKFIQGLFNCYSQNLKEICKKRIKRKAQVNLNILNISPFSIGKKQSTSQWTPLQRKNGIVGLEFEVQGSSDHFSDFYSLVQSFFVKLSYIIKKKSQVSFYQDDIQNYLASHKLKAILLQQDIALFEPPEQVEDIIKQINLKQWALAPKDFLNLDFNLFKQYERQIKGTILQRFHITKLKIDNDKIRFQSDVKTFQKVKYSCKQFLLDMAKEEREVVFLKRAQDIEIIKQYYLENNDFELQWAYGVAKIKSYSKNISENYNKLFQIYKQVIRQKIKIISKNEISHKLVKCTKNRVSYSFFPSFSFQSKDQFKLGLREISQIYDQQLVFFLFNPCNSNRQLNSILHRNCSSDISLFDQRQILTENQCKLKSIFVLKIMNFKSVEIRQKKITKFLEQFISQQKPFRIVLPCNHDKTLTSLLKTIIKYLQSRKAYIKNRNIQFFIDKSENKLEDGSKYYNRDFFELINNTITSLACFKVKNNYKLGHSEMLRAKLFSLVVMRCRMEGIVLNCTSLNSFIFKSEIQSKSGKFKLGIFLPKIECQQFLANLQTEEIYQISLYSVTKIHIDTFATIKKYLTVFKKYFRNQDYAVFYRNQAKNSFQHSFYIYNSEKKGVLQRVQLDPEQPVVYQKDEQISYELLVQEVDCFLLETDRLFQAKLIGLLQNHNQ